MSGFALLFPGQGSQYVGMGKSFYTIDNSLFDEAESVLGFSITKSMFEGPLEELTKTKIAQPAILLHSIAAFYHARRERDFSISCALGHSLGEYSALVALNVISFADAIKSVHVRGKLMQEAVPEGQGSMIAVLGMDADAIIDALLEFSDELSPDYVSCANFNGPLQTVVAGTRSGIEKASLKLKSLGAKRVVELPVSAPFHCALMKPVQEKMVEVLSAINFNDAQIPVVSNVSAQPETSGKKIRELLIKQIAHPVKFTDCVNCIQKQHLLGEGFLEFGPKNILSGIAKKMVNSCVTFSIDQASDLASFTI